MSEALHETPDASVSLRAVNAAIPIIEIAGATDSPDLAVLLYRITDTDERAFAQLYDATSSRVYGLALRVLRSPDLAEEAALHTYLEVWRRSARFDAEECSPIAWILAIALRRVLDRFGSACDAPRPPRVPTRALTHRADATSGEVAQIQEALTWLLPGQLEALRFACRDADGDDTETARLATILSTLVDASVWKGLRRMDGTTYTGVA